MLQGIYFYLIYGNIMVLLNFKLFITQGVKDEI